MNEIQSETSSVTCMFVFIISGYSSTLVIGTTQSRRLLLSAGTSFILGASDKLTTYDT